MHLKHTLEPTAMHGKAIPWGPMNSGEFHVLILVESQGIITVVVFFIIEAEFLYSNAITTDYIIGHNLFSCTIQLSMELGICCINYNNIILQEFAQQKCQPIPFKLKLSGSWIIKNLHSWLNFYRRMKQKNIFFFFSMRIKYKSLI